MSGTISTKSFSFFIHISPCQRDTEYIEYQGPSALVFILVYPEHPTSEYTTQGIDLQYRLDLSGLLAKLWKLYLSATVSKRNVFGKKAGLGLHEGQVLSLRSRMHMTGKRKPGVQLLFH